MQHSTKIPMTILTVIILTRISLIVLPLNYDYPDEYWQGPQIAYKIYNKFVYGKDVGYETWQWTMDQPIRNPVYQGLLAVGYVLVDWMGRVVSMDQQVFDRAMEIAPKAIQCILAVIGDVYLLKLLCFYLPTNHKPNYFPYSFISPLLTPWFYLTMLSRTYINSFQCILTTIAFYYWQQHHFQNLMKVRNNKNDDRMIELLTRNDLISRVVVLVAYVARPTSLIPWVVVWPGEVLWYAVKKGSYRLQYHVRCKDPCQESRPNVPILSSTHRLLMLVCSFIVGSLYFNRLVLTEWNFFYYNLVEGWSKLFDVHPWYFYVAQSMPIIFGGGVVVLVAGVCGGVKEVTEKRADGKKDVQEQVKRSQYVNLCWMTVAFLIILTLISGHKQHRFLMLLMPFFLIIYFAGLLNLEKMISNKIKSPSLKKLFFIICFVIIVGFNLFMLGSVALYPKGGFGLLREIRRDIDRRDNDLGLVDEENRNIGVMYLCQAHALPAYSIILRDVVLLIPDQSPMAKLSNLSQASLLSENPQQLYNQLIQRHNTMLRKDNNKNVQQLYLQKDQVRYLILQHKFFKNPFDLQQIEQNQPTHPENESDKNNETKKWQFLLEDFEFRKVENNRNLLERYIFGQDFLYLYVRKNQ